MEISLSSDSAVLFFRFLRLFSVSGTASPSNFAPPFNDSGQSLKGLNGEGKSLVLGTIALASNGVSFSRRYGHGKSAKPLVILCFFFNGKGADRPKTQNQFLKVGTEHHNSDSIKSEVGMNKNIAAVQDMKMENDGQSETVFGQSGGAECSFFPLQCMLTLCPK